MSLSVYADNGFRLFPCLQDKSPDVPKGESWYNEKYHISQEKAESMQVSGAMIGAWVPDDIIVVDLDRHYEDKDGLVYFRQLKEQLNLTVDFIYDTTVVKTRSGGFHVFFYAGKDHGIRGGAVKVDGREVGIDVKTNTGYVIASGSPGYEYICDSDPAEIPENLRNWLLDVRGKVDKKEKKDRVESNVESKYLPVKMLDKILRKVDVENFRSNDRWLEFITSAIATAGDSDEVLESLESWSRQDRQYEGERNIRSRINSFDPDGGITVGTFIMFLKEEGISKYLIDQVHSSVSISTMLVSAESEEYKIPFEEPDYFSIAESKDSNEFFQTCGNSAAKRLIVQAFNNNVIYAKGNKETFYFNGSRWEVMKDYFSIIYTILFRVAKIRYASMDDTKENAEKMFKIIRTINDTTWKTKTMQEVNSMIREDYVEWDGPVISESITTRTGVIYFRNGKIENASGKRSEFRLKYVDYSSEEILASSEPVKFLEFMAEIFPDKDTFEMAEYAISLCITGNSTKRIFQIWEGDGFNGKSTLIDIIKKVLEGKTITYNPKLLMPDRGNSGLGVTPELYSFMGAYAAFGIEVEQTNEFSTGVIKNLTGGDSITANPKFKDQVEFEATWQLILAVNDLPKFNALDGAFIDRVLIVPFEMTYPKNEEDRENLINKGIPENRIGVRKDKKKLLDGILCEKSAIIKYMIDKYVELETQKGGVISESEGSKKKKFVYVQDNDDFGDFIKNVCVIEENGFCTSEEITEAFKDYMGFKKASSKWVIANVKKYNTHLRPGSKEVIISDNYGNQHKKRRRGLLGIRLKTDMERAASVSYNDKIPF